MKPKGDKDRKNGLVRYWQMISKTKRERERERIQGQQTLIFLIKK